jgi:hypothetical protein
VKKLAGERGYLALEDLLIKSKFLGSKMLILEVERSCETKKPEREEKETKKPRGGRGAGHLNRILVPRCMAPCCLPCKPIALVPCRVTLVPTSTVPILGSIF